MSYCPICESSHHLTEARLLEQGDNSNLMHVQCRKCESSLFVLVVADLQGISSLSVLTDLSEDEVDDFRSRARVTADDVLAFHTMARSADTSWIDG